VGYLFPVALLTSPKLLNTVEDLLLDHRERLYPPTETLSMFLAQALSEDSSCQKAVNATAIQRAVAGLPAVSTATEINGVRKSKTNSKNQ